MLKPFIKWTGGKGRVLNQIIPKFEGLYDDMYVEPFLGGGAVLFRLQPKNAIVADINSNLIITYKMIKNDIEKLILLLKKWKSEYPEQTEVQKDESGKRLKDKNNKNIHTPREEYFYKKRDRYNKIKFYENDIGNGETSDKNIEIAALFLFLNRTAFNGMYRENQSGDKKGRYNVPIGSYKNPNFVNENLLKIVSKYLNENNIEIYCDSYQNILQRVNNRFTDKTKKVLIYLDPPYYPADTSKFTTYTANKFAVEEQIELAKLFKQQKFPTFLSNSSCQEIRNLYENYVIHDIQVMRSISAKASSRGTITEVLIKNELINDGETEEEEKEEIKIENNSTNSNTQNNSMSNKCKSKTKKNKPCKNNAKENGYCHQHKNQACKVNIKYTDDDVKEDEPVEQKSVKQKPVKTAEDDEKVDFEKTEKVKTAEDDEKEDFEKTEKVKTCKTDIVNRGTGAGGSQTNINGKAYEEKTCFDKFCSKEWKTIRLDKSSIYGYYKEMKFPGFTIHKFSQGGMKKYFKHFTEFKTRGKLFREPDEAFFIQFKDKSRKPILKILEKKHQNCDGSVDTKVLAAWGFIKEYKKVFLNKIEIEYAFNLNNWWKTQYKKYPLKWGITLENLEEDNIPIFYGEDDNYGELIIKWIKNLSIE